MFKVLLVDDEQFVTKALKVLIDWEELGYFVCGEAKDGQAALELIREQKPDLVITDIRMPRMDGLNLVKQCVQVLKLNSKFIILSGHNDFKYAQEAIRYGVKEYLLKPVDEIELTEKLKTLSVEFTREINRQALEEQSARLLVNENIEKLLCGQLNRNGSKLLSTALGIVTGDELRYVIIQTVNKFRNQWDEAAIKLETQQFSDFLEKEYGMYIFKTSSSNIEAVFKYKKSSISCITNSVSSMKMKLKKEYGLDALIFLGGKVEDIFDLSTSREQARRAIIYKFFKSKEFIIYYEDIENINFDYSFEKVLLITPLVEAIEKGEGEKVQAIVNEIFDQFYSRLSAIEVIKTCMNNLVIEIMKLLKEMGGEVDDFIKKYSLFMYSIQELTFEEVKEAALKFCLKSVSYIKELKACNSKGIMYEIERYIRNNYMEDINLKSIAEKFYMNSVYLGQQFKKYYGVHFNDYLNNIRINEAKKLLVRTNKKIYEIAESVGYKNTDYFVGRFQKVVGLSPSEYKKSN
jgi:two-component system, response regulator YesN